jgi:hypothetical protein
MPLTPKGQTILRAMESEHGKKAGKSEFYASNNSGRIAGVENNGPQRRRWKKRKET